MAFHVGQRVVCVNVENNHLLTKGDIYTVSGVEPNGVFLCEVEHPACADLEISFFAWRFRPVVNRKTDISSLEALLLTNKVIVTDDAFHFTYDLGQR